MVAGSWCPISGNFHFFGNFVFRLLGSRFRICSEILGIGLGCNLWRICFENRVSWHIGTTKTGGHEGLWTNGAAPAALWFCVKLGSPHDRSGRVLDPPDPIFGAT